MGFTNWRSSGGSHSSFGLSLCSGSIRFLFFYSKTHRTLSLAKSAAFCTGFFGLCIVIRRRQRLTVASAMDTPNYLRHEREITLTGMTCPCDFVSE